jgi:mannose-6-phosphate isomerase-like protein (cupin superfamily)
MIFKSAEQKRERRDRFQGGQGGGFCTHALAPTVQIPGSRFHQASRVELDPGAVIGEHLHAGNEEIYWILSGCGVFIADGIEAAAAPGDLLLTRQGHRHGLRNTGDEPLVFLAIVAGDPRIVPGPNATQNP